ncbi:MAG TPA: molybdate ABC transporter substrate-binding protein, partial [Candidatus Nanopelagicales bacterium]|nr:molybdate ABC transporter substrate-binding protein [Candidatus Nanopelagicales bacterium]
MRGTRAVGLALVGLALAGPALAGCSSGGSGSETGEGATLTVFAAASLTESFDQLKSTFQDSHPGTTVTLSYGGSSTLAEQIVQGAPADVFAAASTTTMATVTDAGRNAGDPVDFATNQLMIVTPSGNTSVTGLADLAKPELTVVLCDSAVPCGAVADKAFAAAGITPAPDSREPDVKSVLAKVVSGDAQAGVVYVTDAKAAGTTVRSVPIPADQNQSTVYPIVAVAGSS